MRDRQGKHRAARVLLAAKMAGVPEPPEEDTSDVDRGLIWERGDRRLVLRFQPGGGVWRTAIHRDPAAGSRQVRCGAQKMTDEYLARSFAWLLKGTPDA